MQIQKGTKILLGAAIGIAVAVAVIMTLTFVTAAGTGIADRSAPVYADGTVTTSIDNNGNSNASVTTSATSDDGDTPSTTAATVLQNVGESSGDFSIDSTGITEIKVNWVSRSITISNCTADELEAEMTVGSLKADGSFGRVETEATLGSVNLTFYNVPTSITTGATIGSAYISLPEGTGYTLSAELTAGRVTAGGTSFMGSGSATVGDGSVKIKIEATAGSTEIEVR